MAKLMAKVMLTIVALLIIGLNALFISGELEKSSIDVEKPKEAPRVIESKDIGLEEVWEIALRAVPGTITDVERDVENERSVYEVDVLNDGVETEVVIDARTGRVISIEAEVEEEVTKEELQTIGGIINEEQAIAIALEEIKGTVIEVEVEREHGKIMYDVKLLAQAGIVEVEVDENGQIVEIEWGDDD